MRASLPMYDWPQLRASHEALWCTIRAALGGRGIDSPVGLAEDGWGEDFWTNPQLVFSQTCGLPYRTALRGKVQLVGTPDFAVEGCAPGYYRSCFVVRRGDGRQKLADYTQAVFAYNDHDSESGYAAARRHAKARGFWFHKTLRTGGHRVSAQVVARGEADIAAIDAVSWRFIERFEAFASDLRVLERTDPTPGLPYITGPRLDRAAVFEAVREAVGALDPAVSADLSLHGVVPIPHEAYMDVPAP